MYTLENKRKVFLKRRTKSNQWHTLHIQMLCIPRRSRAFRFSFTFFYLAAGNFAHSFHITYSHIIQMRLDNISWFNSDFAMFCLHLIKIKES